MFPEYRPAGRRLQKSIWCKSGSIPATPRLRPEPQDVDTAFGCQGTAPAVFGLMSMIPLSVRARLPGTEGSVQLPLADQSTRTWRSSFDSRCSPGKARRKGLGRGDLRSARKDSRRPYAGNQHRASAPTAELEKDTQVGSRR